MINMEDAAIRGFAEEKVAEDAAVNAAEEAAEAITPAESGFVFDFGWLLKKTGTGTVESYLDHPLNDKHSRGRARFLRGATGLLGDIDLAIIDIALGSFEMVMESKGAPQDGKLDHRG